MINVLMATLHLHKLKCVVFRLMSLQLLIASEPCKGQHLTPILRVESFQILNSEKSTPDAYSCLENYSTGCTITQVLVQTKT